MNDQMKMIIITSDENLIQQFSLQNTDNTQIIDLDDEQFKSNNNETINAELSKIVCRRISISNFYFEAFRHRIITNWTNVFFIHLNQNRIKCQENPRK